MASAREGLRVAMGVDRLAPRRIYRRDKLDRFRGVERTAFDALMVAAHLAHGEEIAERYDAALHRIRMRALEEEMADALAQEIAKEIDAELLRSLYMTTLGVQPGMLRDGG